MNPTTKALGSIALGATLLLSPAVALVLTHHDAPEIPAPVHPIRPVPNYRSTAAPQAPTEVSA